MNLSFRLVCSRIGSLILFLLGLVSFSYCLLVAGVVGFGIFRGGSLLLISNMLKQILSKLPKKSSKSGYNRENNASTSSRNSNSGTAKMANSNVSSTPIMG